MHYLVDGYNLLFAFENPFEEGSFEKTRSCFIDQMEKACLYTGLKITLVFDTHYKQEPDVLPHIATKGSLNIIYAPSDLSCDDYILEHLSSGKKTSRWTVVTSDKSLAKQVTFKRFNCISNATFIHLIEKKLARRPGNGAQKPEQMSSHDYQRWQKAFEQKIEENEQE